MSALAKEKLIIDTIKKESSQPSEYLNIRSPIIVIKRYLVFNLTSKTIQHHVHMLAHMVQAKHQAEEAKIILH